MYEQVRELKINKKSGIGVSGLLIRHLVLPKGISGYQDSFKFIAEKLDINVPVSIMSQYFPAYKAKYDNTISTPITNEEYLAAVESLINNNLTGFFQNDKYFDEDLADINNT